MNQRQLKQLVNQLPSENDELEVVVLESERPFILEVGHVNTLNINIIGVVARNEVTVKGPDKALCIG